MLSNSITSSLGVPKERRHAFQDNAIGMVRQVLDGLQAAAQSKLGEAEKKLETTVKENEERQNAVEAAAATLAEKTKMANIAWTRSNGSFFARYAATQALRDAVTDAETE